MWCKLLEKSTLTHAFPSAQDCDSRLLDTLEELGHLSPTVEER
jgi:hypothetical protein